MSNRTVRMKKSAIGALVLVLSLVVASCSGQSGQASGDASISGTLNVLGYAGPWQEQYTKAVVEPFEKKYPDVEVRYVGQIGSAQMLSALQSQKANPATDVSIMDTSVAQSAVDQGLFTKFTEKDAPNLAHVQKQFLNADGWGPAVMADTMALLYDTKTFKTPPTSWNVLWDKRYAGKINMWAPPSLLGIYMTCVASKLADEDCMKSTDAGFQKLEEVAPAIQSFAPNPDEYQSVITGQTVLGIGQNARGQYYHDESGGRLGVAIPTEGTAYQINTINLVKGAPNEKAAKAFINYALSSEAQRAFAEALFYTPTIDNANLPKEVADRVAPTDGSTPIIPLTVDFLAKVRDPWTAKWKQDIVNR